MQLDEDQLKEKRKQRLLKAGFEARARARREKEREKEERQAEERREAANREADPSAWAEKMRKEHDVRFSSANRWLGKEAERCCIGDDDENQREEAPEDGARGP